MSAQRRRFACDPRQVSAETPAGPGRERPGPARLRFALAACFVGPAVDGAAEELHVAFTQRAFARVNRADADSAFKVFTPSMGVERGWIVTAAELLRELHARAWALGHADDEEGATRSGEAPSAPEP